MAEQPRTNLRACLWVGGGGPHQEIGGFVGLIPISIKIGDREIIAGGGHAWVVSPAYRGYSFYLFRELMLWGDQHFLVITGAAEVVTSFTYRLKLITKILVKTFDQHLYWLIRPEVPVKWALNKSEWNDVAKMADHFPFAQVLTRLSRVGFAGHMSPHFQCPKLTVEPVYVFTDEFDQLWEDNRKDYGITAVRDRKSLAWRHFEVPSFIGKTYVFACRDEKKLQGYLALQARIEAAGFLSGHYVVTDVFYQRSRKDVLYNLMNHAFEFAKARGGSLFEVSGCGVDLRDELNPNDPV